MSNIKSDNSLYDEPAIRYLEQRVFSRYDSFVVMQEAGVAAAKVIEKSLNSTDNVSHIIVFLGNGNNAGDGLIVAHYLHHKGFKVNCVPVLGVDFEGDTQKAYQLARQDNVVFVIDKKEFILNAQTIVVDALLGIGLSRPISGELSAYIQWINGVDTYKVYALDIPTGIDVNTGCIMGENAIKAQQTITFLADKIGLHTETGKYFSGKVSIEIPCENYLHPTEIKKSKVLLISEACSYAKQSDYLGNEHKGFFGHALIIGSGKTDEGVAMFGAGILSAISALKMGAGKSSLYAHKDFGAQLNADDIYAFEVMSCLNLDDLSFYSALAVGMGLGKGGWGYQTFKQLVDTYLNQNRCQPILVDADGLYHLKNWNQQQCQPFYPSVITPHEAEAAYLLETTVEKIKSNKLACVRQLANKYQCIAVLKGSGTLISDGQTIWINGSGNIELATAGSGDVLSGMIAGLMARGMSPLQATQNAVFWHGLSAETYLAQQHLSDKSMRASDIWRYL